MTPPNEETIFAGALRLRSDERAAYLDQACGVDTARRQRMERLLSASDQAGGFLEESAPGARLSRSAAFEIPSAEAGTSDFLRTMTGDTIGPYKLLQQIGEGGCGVVYMAGQEEPVRRRVALKVIKLGMDTKSVIARFEAERQALALMDHPNIARVLDAGATQTCRPYFVMELVRGVKITDFCDQNNLSTADRLALFMQVCRAIQHAHQKGIIHRDIKPSNVLVTLHDGVPIPKVIDFGIAKATQGRLTDHTLFTAFEQFIGTPAYTSPEQAEMSGFDIDTRSDIYSLGVLLYELLTGKTPFETKELLAAGLDAMRRTIREKEPVRPSTRLSTMLAGELTTTATCRRTEPPKLIHLLRGDLDWIVMRCLEKDRTRRYETANGLASDINRHLNHEPVLACPSSKLRGFQKLVRRNKLAFTGAAGVSAALIIGLSISTWMFIREKEARQRAVVAELTQTHLREEAEAARYQAETERRKTQIEASKSEQVAKLLKEMLKGVGPSVARGRDTTMLKEILDKTARQIGHDLTNQPEVEIELRSILAHTYSDLGLLKQTEAMARENLQLARARLGEEHAAVADALAQLGDALMQLGNQGEAETMTREALAMKRKLLGNEHPAVADSLSNLAFVLRRQRKLPEAETTQREALTMQRKLLGNEHPAVASSLYRLAFVLQWQGKMAQAEALHREALAMRRKLLGDQHPEVAESLDSLAAILRRADKLLEAEAAYREALEIRKKLFGHEHPEVAESLTGLALVLGSRGELMEAETLHREALAMRRKLLGNESLAVATSLHNVALVLQRQGNLSEAEILCRQAVEIRRKLLGNDHPHVASTLSNLARVLRDQARPAEAEATFQNALAILRSRSQNDQSLEIRSLTLGVLKNLTDLLRERKALAQARLLGEEAAALYQRGSCWPSKEGAHAFGVLRTMLTNLHDFERLDPLWQERLDILRTQLPPDDLQFAAELAGFTLSLLARENFKEAEPLARECLAIREKKVPDDWETFHLQAILGVCLLGQKKYAEAEPRLLSGYRGMKQQEDKIPAFDKPRLEETLQSLAQLYEATGRSEQAARWKTGNTGIP